ncbi:DUF6069 family protein [Actinomadura nitritigenes]|uniref:DUF6069 family protein n=1 Tax=Actinomadura nitritigenes TaxID=134602 RepID=UPI003D93714C
MGPEQPHPPAPQARRHRLGGQPVGDGGHHPRRRARPATRFAWTAVSLTAISFVPPFISGANTATMVTLLGLHLVPATVMIPTLARSLRTRTD